MLGADLKEWRRHNSYTQDRLRLALGVSRQTISAWERSEEPLAEMVHLALLALENLPEQCTRVAGVPCTSADYGFMRRRPSEVGSRVARPDQKS